MAVATLAHACFTCAGMASQGVVVAMGINADGRRQLLGLKVGENKTEASQTYGWPHQVGRLFPNDAASLAAGGSPSPLDNSCRCTNTSTIEGET
jgi:hypothetical protein